ncbi:hypothetical protein [Paenibacillus glucanolyticus]|uniref:hypothetical protein n=1 Tax=Paenibacillus glucanolyticus TaxID=59843 RepID=UPI00096F9F43|nr:hypothetical protein [Paenibacillus glucanolyticus]
MTPNTDNTVKAQSYWVWTKKAQEQNPQFNRAGEPIWHHYKHEAPEDWLERGLICDSTKFVKEGQTTIFDFIEG